MSLLENFISAKSADFDSGPLYEGEFLRLLMFLLAAAREIPLISDVLMIQLTVRFIGGHSAGYGEVRIGSFTIF